MFPLISSFTLLIAYFSIKFNFTAVFLLFFGYIGTTQLAHYLRALLLKANLDLLDRPTPLLSKLQGRFFRFRLSLLSFLSLGIAGLITYKYITTSFWIYNNMLALALAIYSLNKLLVTRFMNGVVYLVGMLMYDIAWVYFTDVMVTVAKELNLPIKLLFP